MKRGESDERETKDVAGAGGGNPPYCRKTWSRTELFLPDDF